MARKVYKNEAGVQADLISALRKSGCFVQRFSDSIAAGIPDLYVEYRGQAGPVGLWIELKYRPGLPKLDKTPLLPKGKITTSQLFWLKRSHMSPLLSVVFLWVEGAGWLVQPGDRASDLMEVPWTAFSPWFEDSPLTEIGITKIFRHLNARAAWSKCLK